MTGYLHVSDVFSGRKSLRANLLGGGALKASGLPFLMCAIACHSDPSLIPGNEHYHFYSRAKALLARWEPMLLQDAHHYWWVKSAPGTLSYVPRRADASFFAIVSESIF